MRRKKPQPKKKPKPPPKKPQRRNRTPYYTDEQIISALRDADGVVKRACDKVGCYTHVVYNRARHVPEIAELIANRHRRMGEIAEKHLMAALKRGETWAVEKCLRLMPGDPYGTKEKQETPAQTTTQQNVFVLSREAAGNMPLEALRAVVETVRQQRRAGQTTHALSAPVPAPQKGPFSPPEAPEIPEESSVVSGPETRPQNGLKELPRPAEPPSSTT